MTYELTEKQRKDILAGANISGALQEDVAVLDTAIESMQEAKDTLDSEGENTSELAAEISNFKEQREVLTKDETLKQLQDKYLELFSENLNKTEVDFAIKIIRVSSKLQKVSEEMNKETEKLLMLVDAVKPENLN